MGGSKNFTEGQLEGALRRSGGLVTQAARTLGTSRQNIHARISRSPHLQAVIAQIVQETLDVAENQVIKKIKKGDGAMTRWFLERKGRDRGYGAKNEGQPPPPADNERRLTVINVLVRSLNARAAAVHAEVHCATQGALSSPGRSLIGHNPQCKISTPK